MFGMSKEQRRMAQYNRNGEKINRMIEEMGLGYITPENITEDDLELVYRNFANQPLIYQHGDQNLFEVKGWVNLDEGTDWAFATDNAGVFNLTSPENMPDFDWTGWKFYLFYRPGSSYGGASGRQEFPSLVLYQAMLRALRAQGLYDILINRAV